MDLTANADASTEVRAVSNEALYQLNESLKTELKTNADANKRLIQQDIERFLTRPDAPRQNACSSDSAGRTDRKLIKNHKKTSDYLSLVLLLKYSENLR